MHFLNGHNIGAELTGFTHIPKQNIYLHFGFDFDQLADQLGSKSCLAAPQLPHK